MSLMDESWYEREERAYQHLFGETGPGIFPLSTNIFDKLDVDAINPRWLAHGVFKCKPTEQRKTWAYVTSGMSNPWESNHQGITSGLGVEFLLETEEESEWAVEVLQTLMAYNLLRASGSMGDLPPFESGHCVPLFLSQTISSMMFVPPKDFPDSFCLNSGRVDLIQVVGITPEEFDQAKQTSPDEVKARLLASHGNLVTRAHRESVI
ncbi:suppressor of fused domain protein [Aestuariicella hydrocarbonica]|uniref:Suppressor of fused domain protein n=1 Tax=Pseudomaricurvus hydrocarbonicus TaxID=1470433 RepID=A0A9E5MJW3_9GAMM|nr:suppressor of fused domain protein [Aestuariicella hydrocarbonica]NHO65724.1 suppressor of fused domain protein [Aestuariicella hydrocarbonica]